MSLKATSRVERLLGLPASTLRFWEKEVVFIAPRKDVFGRRLYSVSDTCILLRLKHLALVRGFGLGKAKKLLENELMHPDEELRAGLSEIRGTLASLYFDNLDLEERLEKAFYRREKPVSPEKTTQN